MLTIQGNKILQDLFSGFRDRYLYNNPGCNENDVERTFLWELSAMIYGGSIPNNMYARIAALR